MKKIAILTICLVATLVSKAQVTGESNVPSLNNHYFVPTSAAASPFTNSSFGMNLGIATSKDFENIIVELGDSALIGLKGSLVFADLNFDYQQQIKNWIAFYLNVGITARIGTELQSMLTQGVNTVTSLRMGWLFHLVEGQKGKLSGSIQVNNHTANFISIGDFITDIIDSIPNPSIAKTVPILNGGVGLRYAHGFSELFGMNLHGNVGYGESYRRGETDFVYHFGALFDANLATKTQVPLGFSLYYNITARPDLVQVPSKSATFSGIKIAYTAAPHFNLGLELSRLRVPIRNVEEKVTSSMMIISTKYFFN